MDRSKGLIVYCQTDCIPLAKKKRECERDRISHVANHVAQHAEQHRLQAALPITLQINQPKDQRTP